MITFYNNVRDVTSPVTNALITFYDSLRALGLIYATIIATFISFIITGISIPLAIGLGWAESFSNLQIFTVVISYICTMLMALQFRFGYLVGIVATAATTVLLWNDSQALAIFNLYLVGSLIYGYVYWGSDDETIPVTKTNYNEWKFNVLFAIVLAAGYCLMIKMISLDGKLDPIDIALMSLSGVAQLMLDRKKLETWIVWIVVNIISIPYFIHIGYHLLAFQYIFFLANAVISYGVWRKQWTSTP